MAIERLADEDEIMLWADEVWPQDIGAIVTLDGAGLLGPDGQLRIDDLKAAIAGRLRLVPRFRQVLHVPPKTLGGPLWVDAAAFDLDEHVKVRRVAAPGGESELLDLAAEFVAARLDRTRPLWEMWFVTGLPGGRVGWLVKVHHSIADGIAGVATFGSFLDTAATTPYATPPAWTPATPPTGAELAADDRQRRAVRRRHMVASLAHPVATALSLAAAWPAVRELLAEPSLPPTSLTLPVGKKRRLALAGTPLEALKEVAHQSDAKVNDVLLTAIAGGLRALLQHRGESVEGRVMRAYVPVTLRPVSERATARGNQIAQMTVPLPVGAPDPIQRLRWIARETAVRKQRSRPSIGKVPHSGMAGRLLLKLIDRQRVNITTADLPGPPVSLFFAGARVLQVFPLLPLIGKVSLGIGALSYSGQFNITVVADGDGFPDLDVFTDGLRRDLALLMSSTGIEAEQVRAAAMPEPVGRSR